MIAIDTPAGVNAMLGAVPGAVPVSYGGVEGWGNLGLPPDLAFEDPELTTGKPAVVVAAGYFPNIGVDEVDGQQKIRGTLISVGEFEWLIARALRADEDGGTVLLMLTDPA